MGGPELLFLIQNFEKKKYFDFSLKITKKEHKFNDFILLEPVTT